MFTFHSILFLYTSSLIFKKYRGDIVKSIQDVLIYNSTCMLCNNAPTVTTIWFSRCLTKHKSSLETAKLISSCKKKENTNKKESTIRGISRRSTIQVLSSPDRVWLRGSNESRFFSLWYDRRQETFVNICHIVVPKEKTVNLQQLQITFNF